jgi:hypothetical protein
MKRLSFLALSLTLAAAADPKLTLEVSKSSDAVEVTLVSSEPIKAATQRWRENPHRLEIVIPKGKLSGKTHKLDRGVVQKLEAKSTAEAAVVELHALQNPKMRWTGSADGKEWTLKVLTTELASDSAPPALPLARPASPVAAKPTPTSRPVVPTRPPVSLQSKPKGTQPAAPRPDQKPVTLTLEKKPLGQAIRELAQCAGMQADVGPGVEGTVTATFTDVPLARALTQILGQQEKLYEYKVVNNRLQVFGDSSGSGATMVVPSGGQTNPSSPPLTASQPTSALSSDYYPIRIEHSVKEAQEAVRAQFGGLQVWSDERLNVLFVRGQISELEKVRQLLASLLAK